MAYYDDIESMKVEMDAMQLMSTNSQPTYTGPALVKCQKILSVVNDHQNENREMRLMLSEKCHQHWARWPRIPEYLSSSVSATSSSDSISSTAEDNNTNDNNDDTDSIDAANINDKNDDDKNDDADSIDTAHINDPNNDYKDDNGIYFYDITKQMCTRRVLFDVNNYLSPNHPRNVEKARFALLNNNNATSTEENCTMTTINENWDNITSRPETAASLPLYLTPYISMQSPIAQNSIWSHVELPIFLDKILDIVECPVSYDTMKIPDYAQDGTLYERESIWKWIDDNFHHQW